LAPACSEYLRRSLRYPGAPYSLRHDPPPVHSSGVVQVHGSSASSSSAVHVQSSNVVQVNSSSVVHVGRICSYCRGMSDARSVRIEP